MSKRFLKHLAVAGSALPLVLLSQSSHAAAFDTAAILAEIASAGTGLTTVYGAFISLSTGILAVGIIYAFIRRKAGA